MTPDGQDPADHAKALRDAEEALHAHDRYTGYVRRPVRAHLCEGWTMIEAQDARRALARGRRMSLLAAIARWLKRPSEPPADLQERCVAAGQRDATGRRVSAVTQHDHEARSHP